MERARIAFGLFIHSSALVRLDSFVLKDRDVDEPNGIEGKGKSTVGAHRRVLFRFVEGTKGETFRGVVHRTPHTLFARLKGKARVRGRRTEGATERETDGMKRVVKERDEAALARERLQDAVYWSGWVKREFYPAPLLYSDVSHWCASLEKMQSYEPAYPGNLYDAISAHDYGAVAAMMVEYADLMFWLFLKQASSNSGNTPFHGASLDGLILIVSFRFVD